MQSPRGPMELEGKRLGSDLGSWSIRNWLCPSLGDPSSLWLPRATHGRTGTSLCGLRSQPLPTLIGRPISLPG